jgi:hypothetical protein
MLGAQGSSLGTATPARGVAPESPTQGILLALQAACEALHVAPDEIDAISLAGCLPPASTAVPLMARAESLAKEFRFSVVVRLSASEYEIRFVRNAATGL